MTIANAKNSNTSPARCGSEKRGKISADSRRWNQNTLIRPQAKNGRKTATILSAASRNCGRDLDQLKVARLTPLPCAPLSAAWLVLSVYNMKTSLSGREPLNGAAESGPDLHEIDVFDVTKSVRAKNRCNAGRLETAGQRFINFLELFGPLRY